MIEEGSIELIGISSDVTRGRTTDVDADVDADADEGTMTLFAPQSIKAYIEIVAVLYIIFLLLLFARFKIRSSCAYDQPHPRIL